VTDDLPQLGDVDGEVLVLEDERLIDRDDGGVTDIALVALQSL